MSYSVNTGAAAVFDDSSGAQEQEARDFVLTDFFTRLDRSQAIRASLAALLHDLFRARLEELVKGMPTKDGGLRLDAATAARVAVLCRTNFEYVDAADQQRARQDGEKVLELLKRETP